MAQHLLIVNTRSGGGHTKARVEALLDEVSRSGVRFESAFTEGPGHATTIARDAAASHETLVAVGGDGTVGEVATGILKSRNPDARLGILPVGTGNDAAWSLGIPDWETGLAAVLGEGSRRIDVVEVRYQAAGRTETRISLIGTGIGFPATVTARASRRLKRVLRRWAYVYAAVACAFTYRPPQMRVVADGKPHEGPFPIGAVVNMEWTAGHSIHMAPGARYDDGVLDVILVRQPNTVKLLARLPLVMRGQHLGLPEVSYFRACEVSVESSPPAELMVDADLVGTTPAQFRVMPGALRVAAPQGET